MKVRFLRVASLAVLALLAVPSRAQDTAPPAAAEAATDESWGTFGIRTSAMDPATAPGDDFNTFVNGAWLAAFELPADRTRYGSFGALDQQAKDRVRAILEELGAHEQVPGSPEARIAAAYKAFMDTDRIEATGMAAAQPWLQRIYAARSREDLLDLFAAPGFASPIGAGVGPDAGDSATNIFSVWQSGLGLPDRDYYLLDTPRYVEIRGKYLDYLEFLFGKAGYQDPRATAQAVLALETDLARAKWDRALSRDANLTYNKTAMADVAALPQGAALASLIGKFGAGNQAFVDLTEITPTEAEYAKAGLTPEMRAKLGGGIPDTMRLVAEVPLPNWQAWLAGRFLAGFGASIAADIDKANFDFYDKLLRGQPEQQPRWKRGIGVVESQLGELLGKIYAERHYPPAQKAAMDDLVTNLRRAMAVNLQDLAWMSPETRAQAKIKLDKFTSKIGRPDRFKTYDGLAISPTDALGNAIAAGDWGWKDELAKLGQPVDRSEWHMFPQTVNAYYNVNGNEIVFPAAVLQPPFFNLSADPAVNYGGIGAVIGHEIGHGFDDQGSGFDGDGNLRDWWTPEDKARFEALQARLGAQYAGHCPFDEGKTCVKPDLTMGENIGDLGGLSLAYRAYRLSLGGQEAPVIDGFTGDQRFFMGWAQVFRSKTREAQARQWLVTDPHSPDRYRINGIVRNLDEWYRAFDVKPDDALYLPPEKRVRIW